MSLSLVTRTIQKLAEKYCWAGMRSDVDKYIQACPHCQAFKPKSTKHLRTLMTPISASYPWQIVGIDLVPYTLPNGDKKLFLFFIDYFSKKVGVSPLRDGTSEECFKKLQEDLIWSESCPSHLISDGGKQFTSDFANEWYNKHGISHSSSTPFHQQANGMAERSIRTFKDILLSKLVSDKMHWKEALKATTCAMNNFLKSGTTGKTPFEIIQGQKYNSPIDNLIQNKISLGDKIKLEVTHNSERMKLKQTDQYNSDKHVRTLLEGDWVLIFNHYKNAHRSPSWLGPFKVLKMLEHDNYLIYNHLTDKFIKINIQFIKKYYPSDSPPSSDVLPHSLAPSPAPIPTSVHSPAPIPTSVPSPTRDPPLTLVTQPLDHIPVPYVPPTATPPPIPSSADIPSHSPVKENSRSPLDPYVGRRIEVYWPSLKKWFPGTVDRVSDNPSKGTHEVAYDDERHYEDPNTYEFLKGKDAARFRFTGEEYDDG